MRLAPLFAAAGAALLLGACAYDHHGVYAGGGGDYYDGYYDDFYGPIYDGYWGDGDSFYFREDANHPFRRDEAGHFRHQNAGGYHAIHGQMHGPRPAAGGERR